MRDPKPGYEIKSRHNALADLPAETKVFSAHVVGHAVWKPSLRTMPLDGSCKRLGHVVFVAKRSRE